MRGVSHRDKWWTAQYQNLKNGIPKKIAYFPDIDPNSEQLAQVQRRKWEEEFGIPSSSNRRKDYTGYKRGDFIVLGDTGKTEQKQQVVLVQNVHTDEMFEVPIQRLRLGRWTGKTIREGKTKNKTVGVSMSKGRWSAGITIEGRYYHLGVFESSSDGAKAYNNALHNWLTNGERPKPVDVPRATNTTGEKYIQYRPNRMPKPWVFEKMTNGKRITRYFSTLSEAIAFKQKYLGGN